MYEYNDDGDDYDDRAATLDDGMLKGCWFNPCDYNVDELTTRILSELEQWDPKAAIDLRKQLRKARRSHQDDAAVIADDIEREAVDALSAFAPVGYWVGYGDDGNSFGCWPQEDEERDN